MACNAIPLIICIFIANKLFRFPAAVALGCVARSRNAVAAIGAIQDNLESTMPMMGYTVCYAVGSVVLILAGMVVTLLYSQRSAAKKTVMRQQKPTKIR